MFRPRKRGTAIRHVAYSAVLIILLFGSSITIGFSQAASTQHRVNAAKERVRVAEGEYKIIRKANDGGIGPFADMVYGFRESWVLWRLPDGSFQVDGEREYESPKDELHRSRFAANLSSEFRSSG